jgi:hypothetical protein
MKITQYPTRRQINSTILAYLTKEEADFTINQYLPPCTPYKAKTWGEALVESMTPPAAEEAWRDYQLYFAAMASDLNGLADTTQNHAELESEAEFEIIVMVSHLANFMSRLCSFHNSIWSRYLAKEVWNKAQPVEDLIKLTFDLVEELQAEQDSIVEQLAGWENLVTKETAKSMSCKEFVITFPFAAGFAHTFCRNAAAMLQASCERQQELQNGPGPKAEPDLAAALTQLKNSTKH